ncbi:MAG: multifunctional CCA addition/repair protein [Burkholderiales bacterium]|nr:MAG: multifunctional CCA addition/repair protein [Burkholderiales bacterium]
MKVYRVGGSVRDELLGLPVADRDFVVVGAAPEALLAQGYLPVGRDFPVFLHPETREEYALARTERKAGRGYRGFEVAASPSVTLEEDLGRRDLTINAMARAADGTLVDPYGGQKDLAAGMLRHVGPAFVEDPLRVLRVARFAARFDFMLAPETEALLRQMVAAGELGELVPERVWQEVSRALLEPLPSRFFALLRRCGALATVLPELDGLFGIGQPPHFHPEIDTGVHVLQALDYAARERQPLEVLWALVAHDLGKGGSPPDLLPRHTGHEARGLALLEQMQRRLRVPEACAQLAEQVTRHHGAIHRCLEWRAETLLERLLAMDALRRPERFAAILSACRIDVESRLGRVRPYAPEAFLRAARAALAGMDLAPVIARSETEQRGAAVKAARLDALRRWRAGYGSQVVGAAGK